MNLNSLNNTPVSNPWKSLNCCGKGQGAVMSSQLLLPLPGAQRSWAGGKLN